MTLQTITALFTANVRERWENVLTTYFDEVFFFDAIEVIKDGKIRVGFRGNPSNWWTSHHRAYLVFDDETVLSDLKFGFVLDKGDGDLHIQFSNVDVQRITQTPEALMHILHLELTE